MIAGGANRERLTRSRRYAQWLMAFLIGAACGYGLRSPKEREAGNPCLVTASAEIAKVSSFSEIANTKEALNTLAYQFVTTSFNKHAHTLAHKTVVATTDPEREEALRQYVAELKEGVEEFKGTEQEMRVFQRLLLALKGDARWSEWLDTYLDVLYRHPTHELVGNLATDAVGAASFTGRETELEQGLTHVLAIPLEFDSKPALEQALNQIPRPNQIAVMIGDASLLCLHN